jgi:hypothetical protein
MSSLLVLSPFLAPKLLGVFFEGANMLVVGLSWLLEILF